jgi:predicted nucleic acid-binding protein
MTKRYFLDTNVFLRYFLVDSSQSPACAQLIQAVEDGTVLVATSSIVLLELHFVLKKIYGFAVHDLQTIMELVLSIRNLQLCETTDIHQALVWHTKFKIKLADCLILTQVPAKAGFISYDKEFDRFDHLERLTPELIIQTKN